MKLFAAFLVLFVLIASHTEPGSVNDKSRMAGVESLLERNTIRTEGSFYFNRLDMVFFKDHFYSDKPPLLSLYSAAILWPVHVFVSFGDEEGRAVLYYLTVVLASGFSLAAIFYFLSRALKAVHAAPKASFLSLTFIFFGSILLPFGTTYNNHAVEAALLCGAFWMLLKYRTANDVWAPVGCAVFLGLSSLVHLVTGMVFLGTTTLYFLTQNVRDFLKYFFTVCLILAAGLGLNKLLYDEWKPFYLMPETYLYDKSYWLTYPTTPGLTHEKIVQRFDELNLPEEWKIRTLAYFHAYRQKRENTAVFAGKRFVQYDYLIFTPIFLIGLWAAGRSLFRKDFLFKKETLWVLAGTAGTYAVLLGLRSDPGWSFGNRHLLPVVPLVLFFSAFYFEKEDNRIFFRWVFWVLFSAALTGVAQPWKTPPISFFYWNLALGALLLGVEGLRHRWSGLNRAFLALDGFLVRRPWMVVPVLAGLFVWQFSLYAS